MTLTVAVKPKIEVMEGSRAVVDRKGRGQLGTVGQAAAHDGCVGSNSVGCTGVEAVEEGLCVQGGNRQQNNNREAPR